jgi:hypothetical protein
MAANPPSAAHQKYVEAFKHIGLIPGQPFQIETLSIATRTGLVLALNKGQQLIPQMVKYRGGISPTCWNKVEQVGYAHDYLNRAAIAFESLFTHSEVEATYFSTYKAYVPSKTNGQHRAVERFNSSNQYILHFEPEEIPKTEENGFWSITLCGPERQLLDNELNLFSISDRTEGVVTNEDGSLDFYIQSERPSDAKQAGNWLPCPKGEGQKFCLNYCICLPSETAQSCEDEMSMIPPVIKREPLNLGMSVN